MIEGLLERTLASAIQDGQTVTPDGERTATPLEGVLQRRARTHVDDRGTLVEMLDPRWGWHPSPIVYAYTFTERPGSAKGWAIHKKHEDRYFLVSGELELVLYDVRPDSATCGKLWTVVLTELDRSIINIPAFVWHATRNLGTADAVVVNFPTIPYDHDAPDKYRLPLDTPLIPYAFGTSTGW
jgi:dTDP-4-dehydrorhamnose 3,5-epimerase